jgi:hypothetical protein
MGQGTYFTNNFNHEKAAWIDFERNEDADEFANETTICDLGNICLLYTSDAADD